jgi:predicted nucleic acid-binding Zn ribbon protein
LLLPLARSRSGFVAGHEKLGSSQTTLSQVTSSGDMRMYQALSYGDKWRVTRQVAKGEAPHDPRMASAAVELAERYQRRGRNESTLYRFLAIALILVGVALAILAAIEGHALVMGSMALIALTNAGQLVFNPMLRQKNVARSLEASRRVSRGTA